MVGLAWLLLSLLLHILDTATDSLTTLLYFSQTLYLPGISTLILQLLPGLVSCVLELREAWLGRGNVLRAVLFLLFCPVYTWITLLFSLYNSEWRSRAMFLVTMEGFITSGPQLILQLSFWMRGCLTLPGSKVLEAGGFNLTTQIEDQPFQLLGREYNEETFYWFGLAQLGSILVSFLTLTSAGLYFNELETGGFTSVGSSFTRILFGLPFFIFTSVFRAGTIAIVMCVLNWWSAVIIFLLFFLTVLTGVWSGDRFSRCCLYGFWSLLLPVGYARDPLESMGYKVYYKYSVAELDPVSVPSKHLTTKRAKYFLGCHLGLSLGLLLPALIVSIVLVNLTPVATWLLIYPVSVLPTYWLNTILLPVLGLMLGLTILLANCYISAIRNQKINTNNVLETEA